MPNTRLFIAVAILVVVLLTAGWWAADIQTAQMQRWLATGHLPPIGNPWKGTSTPDFDYYMTINAIFVSILLLIPAIGAFVLRRPGDAGPAWLLFWTAAGAERSSGFLSERRNAAAAAADDVIRQSWRLESRLSYQTNARTWG